MLVLNVDRPFWAGASANAVVIEADAFKESDVIYRALSSRGHHDMLHTAELACPSLFLSFKQFYAFFGGFQVKMGAKKFRAVTKKKFLSH